jgi:hypothetical protein
MTFRREKNRPGDDRGATSGAVSAIAASRFVRIVQ